MPNNLPAADPDDSIFDDGDTNSTPISTTKFKNTVTKELGKKSQVETILIIAAIALGLYAGYKWYTGKKS